jgi:hypothetical protein
VETVDLGIGIQWQISNVSKVVLLRVGIYRVIQSTLGELESYLLDTLSDVSTQNGLNESDILVISDSTAIVNLSSKVIKHLERNYFIVIKESFQLLLADIKVFKCECIWDVPTNGSELSSVLNDSMEERESEKKHLIFLGLVTVVKQFVIKYIISSQKIRTKTLRWLKSHLN